MDDEELLPSRAPLPDISGDNLSRLLRGGDPALNAAIAEMVELVRARPEEKLAGWNNYVDARPTSS